MPKDENQKRRSHQQDREPLSHIKTDNGGAIQPEKLGDNPPRRREDEIQRQQVTAPELGGITPGDPEQEQTDAQISERLV